jgi:hypothetical protein
VIAGRAELFPLPEGEGQGVGQGEGEQSELWSVGAKLQKLSNGARPPAKPGYVFSAVVGMARCAVPARVAAGGTNIRATVPFDGVAPLHAARTSPRDVPTTTNIYKLGFS